MLPINLFYFYDPADEGLYKELEKHLSPLRQEGVIREWHSGMTKPGDVYERIQYQQLQQASLVLLLLSPDLIAASDLHTKALKQAFEQQAAGTSRIILILLRPVDWEDSLFANLRYLPQNRKPVMLWENRDSAFFEIARSLKQLIQQDKQIASHHRSENIQARGFFLIQRLAAILPLVKRAYQFLPYGLSLCSAIYLLLLWSNRQNEIIAPYSFTSFIRSPYAPIFLCIAVVLSEFCIFWEGYRYPGQKRFLYIPFTFLMHPLPALASLLNLSSFLLSLLLLFLPLAHFPPTIVSTQRSINNALQVTQSDAIIDSYLLPTPLPTHYSYKDYASSKILKIPVVHISQPDAVLEDQNVPTYLLVLQIYNQNQLNTLQISKVTVIIDAIDSIPHPLNFWKTRSNPFTMSHPFVATHNNYQSIIGTRITAYSSLPFKMSQIELKPHDSDIIDLGLRSTWPVSMTFHVEILYIANQESYVMNYQPGFHVIFTDDSNWHPYSPNATGLFVPYQGKE